MADKQISEFPFSNIEDTDILHTKKLNGEDAHTSFEDMANEILDRVPDNPPIFETPTAANLQPSDFIAIADNSNSNQDGKIAVSALYSYLGNLLYPVGSYYLNYSNSSNPSSILGFGTWTQIRGRVIVGQGQGTDINGTNQTFNQGSVGGEYRHTLTTAEMPTHTHNTLLYEPDTGASSTTLTGGTPPGNPVVGSATSGSAGSGSSHNNVQPYEVAYMWRRTA